MLAREKDAIRKAIDFLIILPISLFLIAIVCDTFFRRLSIGLILGISATLIIAFMIKRWLKPISLAEQRDRLLEEKIFLIDKIKSQQQSIETLKKSPERERNWSQNEIDSKSRHITEMNIAIEEIQQKLSKFEIMQA